MVDERFYGWRYRASDRRMDRKSDHASVRLEAGPSLTTGTGIPNHLGRSYRNAKSRSTQQRDEAESSEDGGVTAA